MGLTRNQNFVKGALIVSSVGLLFHLIGFASPYWYYSESTSGLKFNGGLWKQCAEIQNIKACTDIKGSDAKSYQKAAQAMGMIGLFCCIGGVVVIVLKQFVMKEHSAMNRGYFIAIGLLAAAAHDLAAQAMGIIGIIVSVAGNLVVVLKQFAMKESAVMKHGYIIAIGLLSAAALFVLIEMAIVVGEAESIVKENLSWATGLDITGMILMIVAPIIIAVPSQESV